MKHQHESNYKGGSLSLIGADAMGTGVMITSAIAYSYVKLSNAYPSVGGIAMFLQKAYGKGTATAVFALLIYLSMVINESRVARTLGQYTVQIMDTNPTSD